MKKLFTLFLFLTSLFSFNMANAQSPFSVTLRGGYGIGGYEATHAGLGSGKVALRLGVSYTFMPILDAYIAYSRAGFSCVEADGGFCQSADVDFTTSGINVGLRVHHAPDDNIWIPWFRAGLVYQSLKWDRLDQNYNDSGLGFEVATGIAYPVTEQIKIVPSVNYTRFSIEGANGVNNAVVVISGMIGARYEF